MGQYEKFGDLLRDAIENDTLFKEKENKKKYKDTSTSINADSVPENEQKTKEKTINWTSSDLKSLKILNLDEDATETEIKEAYRNLLKKYHPDNIPKYPEMQKTASEKTRKIVEAYRKLIKKNDN